MKSLVKYKTDGDDVIFEVQEDDISRTENFNSKGGRKIIDAEKSFEDSLSVIKNTINKTLEELKSMANTPDELAMEFAVKFQAKSGVVFTSLGAEANFKVTVTWRKSEEAQKTPAQEES